MKYFSMFAGIGGFELGIQNALRSTVGGVKADTPTDEGQGLQSTEGQDTGSPNGRVGSGFTDQPDQRSLCVGYSEIDKYAIKVYERQFNGHRNYGDATTIDAGGLPDFDLLCGGFPCQAFSIAGKRGGFNDTRGTLFFDIARILRAKRPSLCVFENVKGLLSHDGGRTFDTIIRTLDELGYDCQWQVLNSKDWGVPQNRERVYIVGHLRGEPRPEVFPISGQSNEHTTLGQSTEAAVARTLTAGGHSGGNHSGMTIVQLNDRNVRDRDRVYDTVGLSPTITSSVGGGKQPFITNPKMNSYKPNYEESVAITASAYKEPPVVSNIRRLTPKECERLQGFPDNWTLEGTDGLISDTQRYKMCGNAVTVNVVQAVMERVLL